MLSSAPERTNPAQILKLKKKTIYSKRITSSIMSLFLGTVRKSTLHLTKRDMYVMCIYF